MPWNGQRLAGESDTGAIYKEGEENITKISPGARRHGGRCAVCLEVKNQSRQTAAAMRFRGRVLQLEGSRSGPVGCACHVV